VFRRGSKQGDVLFIDASRDFAAGKNQNTLREADLAWIVQTYRAPQDVDKYARAVPLSELASVRSAGVTWCLD